MTDMFQGLSCNKDRQERRSSDLLSKSSSDWTTGEQWGCEDTHKRRPIYRAVMTLPWQPLCVWTKAVTRCFSLWV